MNPPQKEHLIKEIIYRASRRGTKELDTLFKPFTNQALLAPLAPETLALIKQLLLESEAYLMHHLIENPQTLPQTYAPLKSYLKKQENLL